ncbi:YtxH-like protein [Formosa agariphila KMM 3901]|uniref:YtxH-like protein n=1 Tax=Formosa agariphila (strain DSM 15362 / KCTC 12365 / LMG 23005 / KMM 3901 / M-2Alg 35-1) TaxID=1347342 RepID=T2KMR4_FORAG|nr:YtxH domain-containing protein [Formosa agariphila]CDF79743.1 YtxH-like protein [Formosa agariphila KMM 3901]
MSKSGNTVLGLLAGTAIGALFGILYAPDKGSKTRQRLSEEALAARDKMNSEAHDLKEKVSSSAHDLKEKVNSSLNTKKGTLDEQIESIVTDASHKADDVISSLEKKLAKLKDQNKKYQKS